MFRLRTCPNCKQKYSLFKHLKTTSYLYYTELSCDSCYAELKISLFSIFLRFLVLIVSIVSFMTVYDFFNGMIKMIPFGIIYFLFIGWLVSFLDIYTGIVKRKTKRRKSRSHRSE